MLRATSAAKQQVAQGRQKMLRAQLAALQEGQERTPNWWRLPLLLGPKERHCCHLYRC